MKVISIPSSGKLANTVAFMSPFGQAFRTWVAPRNTASAARDHMRGSFGKVAQMWGRALSPEQRDRWNYAGPQVLSHPRLGRGPLSGQQHFQGINSARACVGLGPVFEPPTPAVFGPSPVDDLVITNDEGGARLFLRVSEQRVGGDARPAEADIMVFGQAPCSAGRSKRRNVSFLGLVGPVIGGLAEITDLYKAKFGEPRPGTKVFIVTRQHKDGWEGPRHVTNEIVPGPSAGQQATAKTQNGLKPLMYKGCTRDVHGTGALGDGLAAGGGEVDTGRREAAETASRQETEGLGPGDSRAGPGS